MDVVAEVHREDEDEVEEALVVGEVVSVDEAAIVEVEEADVEDLAAEVVVTEADVAEDVALAEDVGVVEVGDPEVVEVSEGHSSTLLLAQKHTHVLLISRLSFWCYDGCDTNIKDA